MEIKECLVLLILIIITVCKTTTAVKKYKGKCPEIAPMKKLNMKKFLGSWYVQNYYEFDDQPKVECQQFAIWGYKNRFYEFEMSLKRENGNPIVNTRSAVIRYLGENNGIEVKRRKSEHDNPPHTKNIPTRPMRFVMYPLNVVYDSYAAMYTCIPVKGGYYIGAWIMTRECNPKGKVILSAQSVFSHNDIDLDPFHEGKHRNCKI